MNKQDQYRERAVAHAARRDAARRVSTALSRWRLATVLPAIALLIWSAQGGGASALAGAAVLFLAFGVLVVRHARVDERAAWFDALRAVNELAIARIERRWDGLLSGEPPAGLAIDGHPYAVDLDLFGRASLFQWLGPAATPNGALTLAQWLLTPANPAEVQVRQEAVDDLAPREEWREQLAAFGSVAEQERPVPIGAFLAWAESATPSQPYFETVRAVAYVVTGSLWMLIALHAIGLTPVALWPIPLVIGMILSFVTAPSVIRAFDAAGSGQTALKRHARLFAHLVSVSFATRKLNGLQERLGS
ncbi:MAG: hypothetical protein H0U19_15280, partial [Acidobacteria bacterium]|nr:hypothetical protein [Acidobacteriota bacterium]